MTVRFDVPEAEVQAFHRRRRTSGVLLFAGGVLTMVTGIAGSMWFGPLAILCMVSCLPLLFGGVMATQSHRALKLSGDLSIVIDQRHATVRYGGSEHWTEQPLASVIREAGRLDFLVHTHTIETTSVPLDEAVLDTRIAELAAEGVLVTVPDRSPLRIAGLVVGVVVAVVALLLVLRLVPLLMLGGMVAGLDWLAPDDPGTQVGLFFGLAFGIGGPVLIYRIVQRFRS